MTEDITKDPEYIRGYEEAKRSIEREKTLYQQGRRAAFLEEVSRENESIPAIEISKRNESFPISGASFARELIDVLRDFIAIERKNSEGVKNLDERLKALEKYTQE